MLRIAAALVALGAAAVCSAQGQGPTLDFELDGSFRDEWTRDILEGPNQERWRLQLRPRLELRKGALTLGAGAELNRSDDRNVEPKPLLLRDNYDSRDVRLDLAFGRVQAGAWLRLSAGRFVMPVGLTEMTWDRDLRPQGAALSLLSTDSGGTERVALTVLGARGSHVFDDEGTEMLIVSGRASWPSGPDGTLELTGSFLTFHDLGSLEPMIRRQNTRMDGVLSLDYRVLDLVARLRREGGVRTELVADYCWNTGADELNRGLWLAAVLGSTRTAKARLEYTFARVDRDATVAAYATDDFFWATGWKGHRGDLGLRLTDALAVHLTGQLQRFKDSPRVEERDHWVKRIRVDVRLSID